MERGEVSGRESNEKTITIVLVAGDKDLKEDEAMPVENRGQIEEILWR